MKTTCEECQRRITLTDNDGILIGAECKCGYYVTRYIDAKLAQHLSG